MQVGRTVVEAALFVGLATPARIELPSQASDTSSASPALKQKTAPSPAAPDPGRRYDTQAPRDS